MGGEIAKEMTVAQTWYRRVCEVSLAVGLIIVSLFAIEAIAKLAGNPGFGIFVPLPALGVAIVTILVSPLTFWRFSDTTRQIIAFTSYGLAATATAVLITSTDSVASPYVFLWMIVAVMSGALSGFVTLFLLIASNIYFVFQLVTGQMPNQSEMIAFAITNDLPLLAAFAIWFSKKQHRSEKEQAFSALAHELSQVANKSEIVINAIADGVIAVDEKGVIQLINPAAQAIVGWGKQDALHLDYRSVLNLVDKDDKALQETVDPVQICLRTNESAVTEKFSLLTTSGKRVMTSLLVSPVGKLGSGAIIVFRDITAQASEERQQAEFISTASHEMRTPVAAIEGYLGLALNPATATIDVKARSYIEKAHEAAQHLGRLFQDLLDISKAEDGRLKNDPQVIDVVSVIRDITTGLIPGATAKNLTLVFAPDMNTGAQARITPVFYSLIDLDHLREVTSNLIENAIKYTKEGSVTVDVTGDDKHVSVSITDTGIGIPPEDIPHLFQKFYRVDSTDTREIGGTGLGLYLSRRLIESVGGRLDVTSEYGKGSTFSVEIDRMPQEDAMRYIEQHSGATETVAPAPVAAATPAPAPTPAPTPATSAAPTQETNNV